MPQELLSIDVLAFELGLVLILHTICLEIGDYESASIALIRLITLGG
jgi:hypothetical protein